MKNIDYQTFHNLSNQLADKIMMRGREYKNIYPIPKNGLYVAVEMSKLLNLPVITDEQEITDETLIVDDIIDSGRTIKRFGQKNDFAVLILKNQSFAKNKKIFFAELGSKDTYFKFFFEPENDMENNLVRILQYIGEDANREGLRDTPKRIIKSWDKLFGGYKINPDSIITTFTNEGYDEMIILKDIEFFSTCEHHFLPFYGKCSIGYIPNKKIIGVSKLARVVEVFARRLQIQERLTNQIADFIMQSVEAKGVMVVMEGVHLCMIARGVEKKNAKMVTSAIRGVFKINEARNEFLNMIKN